LSKLRTELENSKLEVDLDSCTSCKSCVRECPLRLYYFRNKNLALRKAADLLCMECGHCFAVCPENAIQLKNFLANPVVDIPNNFPLPSYEMFLNLVMARRSVRQFRKEQVPADLWRKLLEAGRHAPTGHNDQLVHFTIIRNQKLLKEFSNTITQGFMEMAEIYKDKVKFKEIKKSMSKTALGILKGLILPHLPIMLKGIAAGEDFWRWNGEVLIIHAPKKTTTLIEDCAVAAAHIMLAAPLLDLGTCSLGIATVALNLLEDVKTLVALPKNHIAAYTLAVGFPHVKYYRIPPRQHAKITWL